MNGILSPDKNPAYGDWHTLPVSLWTEINSLDKRLVSNDFPGLEGSGDTWALAFLGKTLQICPAKRRLSWLEVEREPTFQEGLVALTYLLHVKPIDLSRKWVSPVELPGGRTFFSPASHPPKTSGILSRWENHRDHFHAIMNRLKGSPIPQGDEGFQVPSLPMVPLQYIFWEGDANLPPAVTLLVNATAHLILPLDTLWALINLTDQCFEPSESSALFHE